MFALDLSDDNPTILVRKSYILTERKRLYLCLFLHTHIRKGNLTERASIHSNVEIG